MCVNGKKATRPCPCGMAGASNDQCHCSAEQIQRYLHRVSGPLLDRIDIQVEVLRPSVSVLDFHRCGGEKTETIRARVVRARYRQIKRQRQPNALLDPTRIRRYCRLGKEQRDLLETAAEQLGFSPRACHRVLKVSRTIADLDGKEGLQTGHLAEAIALRSTAFQLA